MWDMRLVASPGRKWKLACRVAGTRTVHDQNGSVDLLAVLVLVRSDVNAAPWAARRAAAPSWLPGAVVRPLLRNSGFEKRLPILSSPIGYCRCSNSDPSVGYEALRAKT